MPVPKGTRIGGRQKGTPNKRTKEVANRLAAMDFDVLGLRVELYKDAVKAGDIALQDKILSDLMPYMYPKHKTMEVDVDLTVEEVIKDVTDEALLLEAQELGLISSD